MTQYYIKCLLIISFFSLLGCSGSNMLNQSQGAVKVDSFGDYWYQSKAEISTYKLEQARYGEIREGHATMIFVTEPFNTRDQVKADNAMADNVTSVLKLNHTRKFNTGIYPYSTMTSSFTPVDISGPSATLKLTNTVQEWCGQTYMQMNKRMGKYQLDSYSYFESEGDQSFSLEGNLLEDELFSLIRINPQGLPTGEMEVIPSAVYLRFSHNETKAYTANISLSNTTFNGEPVKEYSLNYPELNRQFTIYYNKEFPFEIEGWKDSYQGFKGPILQSTATKINQKQIDYWNKNSLKDSILYQELLDFTR